MGDIMLFTFPKKRLGTFTFVKQGQYKASNDNLIEFKDGKKQQQSSSIVTHTKMWNSQGI